MRKRRIGLSLILLGALSLPAHGALLYKNYVVRKAGGADILCDPYTVQPGDYVLKLFRARGEIAPSNFPRFLALFKAVNPDIPNIDAIAPGEMIFIPLKPVDPDAAPSGVVTIPYMTPLSVEELLAGQCDVHRIRKGESVGKLLASRFGALGPKAFQESLKLFKLANPDIPDMDRIREGASVRLPRPSLLNGSWYASPGGAAPPAPREDTPLTQAATLLEGTLYARGAYFFPRERGGDITLNLARNPVIDLPGGKHVLFTPPGGELSAETLSVLQQHWQDLALAAIPESADLSQVMDAVILAAGAPPPAQVLTDRGVTIKVTPRWRMDRGKKSLAVTLLTPSDEKTPAPVLDYLKGLGLTLKEVGGKEAPDQTPGLPQIPALGSAGDRKGFVLNFFEILGAGYSEHVNFSFPYGKIQIQASGSILSRADGVSVLMDFGDLQGDAIASIAASGIRVVSISATEPVSALIPKLLAAAGMESEADPTLPAADHAGAVTIQVPGFLGRQAGAPRFLLTPADLTDDLVRFFAGKGIQVVSLDSAQKE